MPLVDMPLEALESFRPDLVEPQDFDDFWRGTLNEAQAAASDRGTDVTASPADSPVRTLDVLDVTFPGFAGEPIKAWLIKPVSSLPLPLVIEYIGYGGGRGLTIDRLAWASCGFAHLVVDTRGQGSSWGNGSDTPDFAPSGPSHPGFMTRGILDPRQHYYRRAITDAARAIDAAPQLPGVDATRVVLTGVSQGGGLTIAAAGLRPDAVVAAMPDVAFLCNIRRGSELSDVDPYREIKDYLAVRRGEVEQAFRTLSYVDAVHHAKRATAPSLWSVGLMDDCCPPSTTFSAYNWYGALAATEPARRMEVYPFNGHDGGGNAHVLKQIAFARALTGTDA